MKRAGIVAAALALAAASTAFTMRVSAQGGAQRADAAPVVARDTTGLVPAGYGTLRRDDVGIAVTTEGLTIRAIPLDESVIRTLAPDSYRTLHALREGHVKDLERIRTRLGLQSVQAWFVSFFNAQPGAARYDPRGMQIRSAGRDFRPLDVIPLVTGFEDGRLVQGRSVNAIFAFDAAVALDHPLDVTLAGQQSSVWGDDVIQLLERERSAIWSRAGASRKPTNREGGSPPWR